MNCRRIKHWEMLHKWSLSYGRQGQETKLMRENECSPTKMGRMMNHARRIVVLLEVSGMLR